MKITSEKGAADYLSKEFEEKQKEKIKKQIEKLKDNAENQLELRIDPKFINFMFMNEINCILGFNAIKMMYLRNSYLLYNEILRAIYTNIEELDLEGV